MAFDRNVFINCPFDKQYLPMLRPLLFTVLYLQFRPRIALETLNSGAPRVTKIMGLIRGSQYGIHDLSRIQAKKKGEFFRLNMPFELGLDVGCQVFGKGNWRKKKCLIMEVEPYRYQAAISDLSNSDIAAHGGDPYRVVLEVRKWLNREAKLNAPGATHIWTRFNEFMAANYDKLRAEGHSPAEIAELDAGELIRAMNVWLRRNRS